MTVMLDSYRSPAEWLVVADDEAAAIASTPHPRAALSAVAIARANIGLPFGVVGDDDVELSVEDALTIAAAYGGGEFDHPEMAAVVAALCVLRDHIDPARTV